MRDVSFLFKLGKPPIEKVKSNGSGAKTKKIAFVT